METNRFVVLGMVAALLLSAAMPATAADGNQAGSMQGARDGVFSVQSPAVTARALMWSYETFSPPALFLRDERTLIRDLDLLHELVFAGLLAR